MGDNLATKQLGGTDQANQDLLHTSGTALASGARIADGGGNDSGLVLGTNWIGIHGSGGFQATLTYSHSANLSFALPTAGTALVSNTGNGVTKADFLEALGIEQKVVSADVTNATTSAVAVTDLDWTPAVDGIYRLEWLLRVQTTNVSTEVDLDIDGPAEADEVVGSVEFSRAVTLANNQEEQAGFNAFPSAIDGAALAAVDTGQLIKITALLVMSSSTPTDDVELKLRASNTSGTVKIMEGSVLRIEKLN
jgi:hypothetical protein